MLDHPSHPFSYPDIIGVCFDKRCAPLPPSAVLAAPVQAADDARPSSAARAPKRRFNIRPYLAALFVFECVAWTMALVVLGADSLSAVFPRFTTDEYKLLAFVVMAPITFLPMHLLSFTSMLGMATSLSLITIVLLNGFTTTVSPGSVLHPMATDLWPSLGAARIGISGGLIMSGYGGHAIMPTSCVPRLNFRPPARRR